jgi:hypothetical protein
MKRAAAALVFALLLHACGGGGEACCDMIPQPPPPPAQVALNASNYQGALSDALESANAAFAFAKLGADAADQIFGIPLALPRAIRCPVSGTASIELTDRNRNGALDMNDTVHIFMSECDSSANPLTGVVRIEVISAAPLGNGREHQFAVEIADLVIASTVSGVAPLTINFSGNVFFTRTTDFDHYVVSFGDYDYSRAGQTRSATELLVDYLQRYDTLSYEYLVQGTVAGAPAQGQFRMTTPVSLTGTIGAFPSAGRIMLAGSANSSAQISEEGVAANNGATVLVSVDANGDGTADSAVPEFEWSTLLSLQVFASLRNHADPAVLPIP